MKNQINLSFSEMQPVTLQGNKSLMSAELAHQKADKHLCVALHIKVRIRLHPSKEHICGIHKQEQLKDGKIEACPHYQLYIVAGFTPMSTGRMLLEIMYQYK